MGSKNEARIRDITRDLMGCDRDEVFAKKRSESFPFGKKTAPAQLADQQRRHTITRSSEETQLVPQSPVDKTLYNENTQVQLGPSRDMQQTATDNFSRTEDPVQIERENETVDATLARLERQANEKRRENLAAKRARTSGTKKATKNGRKRELLNTASPQPAGVDLDQVLSLQQSAHSTSMTISYQGSSLSLVSQNAVLQVAPWQRTFGANSIDLVLVPQPELSTNGFSLHINPWTAQR